MREQRPADGIGDGFLPQGWGACSRWLGGEEAKGCDGQGTSYNT